MASRSCSRACCDSSTTNRHGTLWCGAGAVYAASIARRTAAESTGCAENSRTVRRASGTSAEPYRNISSPAGLISAAAPGPAESVTSPASPRTIATGMPMVFPLTRSAAAAISSATAARVTSSGLPNVSLSPRWSRTGTTPAAPMAASVWPIRQGLPRVSVTITPIRMPRRPASALRSRRADASGSSGSRATVPGGVLELSTPAAASTRPCLVSTILAGPRWATSRTVSASMACSRSAAMSRPSALLMIFEVTTRMSPSARSGAAASISSARSAPGVTSGSPVIPVMLMPVMRGSPLPVGARPRRSRPCWPDPACTAGARGLRFR